MNDCVLACSGLIFLNLGLGRFGLPGGQKADSSPSIQMRAGERNLTAEKLSGVFP